MSYTATFQQSNRADWIFDVTATDADTGDDIDWSAATAISFAVCDNHSSWDCPLITATLANGLITLPVTTTIEVSIPGGSGTDLGCMRPGTYPIGMTYELNDEINQIFVGTVSIYDGIARI